MRTMIFLAALTLPGSLAAAPLISKSEPQLRKARCPAQDGFFLTREGQVGNGYRRLGDLPPARHFLTVWRDVGGCPAPAIVRTGIGPEREVTPLSTRRPTRR